ncbi:MAG: hypothetical protein WC903_08480, partial [Candidatus Margulisiibacteriota bacterium]
MWHDKEKVFVNLKAGNIVIYIPDNIPIGGFARSYAGLPGVRRKRQPSSSSSEKGERPERQPWPEPACPACPPMAEVNRGVEGLKLAP